VDSAINDLREELLRKIKVLSEQVWEGRAKAPQVDRWLSNFTGEQTDEKQERLFALFLLSQFMYFGGKEMRELLRCLFRDLYKYPIVRETRKAASDTTDTNYIHSKFDTELKRTRFLGVGNPAESGTHLLYYFRQENNLHKSLFINSHEIFNYATTGLTLRDPSISRYVFIDDLAGSGIQATQYSQNIVKTVKALKSDAIVSYHVIFATSEALKNIRTNTDFDRVEAVFDLDPTFKCFGDKSRYFPAGSQFGRSDVEKFAQHYGQVLWPKHPLGYRAGQLLLGFNHNTPDNTLPIFWFDYPSHAWEPIFRRYPKIEW
jgi:hypothetical protein